MTKKIVCRELKQKTWSYEIFKDLMKNIFINPLIFSMWLSLSAVPSFEKHVYEASSFSRKNETKGPA